jgi:hypothetical protein
MCDFAVDLDVIAPDVDFSEELSALASMEWDGLVEIDGTKLTVTNTQPVGATYSLRRLGKGRAAHCSYDPQHAIEHHRRLDEIEAQLKTIETPEN